METLIKVEINKILGVENEEKDNENISLINTATRTRKRKTESRLSDLIKKIQCKKQKQDEKVKEAKEIRSMLNGRDTIH